MTENPVTITLHAGAEVEREIAALAPDRLFLLMDDTTARLCRPLMGDAPSLSQAVPIVIGSTDSHKNLASLTQVWTALQEGLATRHSLLLNLGGGMVTDLGGFAAATFKRGIAYINLPTTLLSMVDASVGGKTGINFGGLKNEIGAFSQARRVVIDTRFLSTLDSGNILSGYAEMLKHALLSGREMWRQLLAFDILEPDLTELGRLIGENVEVKKRIVTQDPQERGLRKALNLGHTLGHALESFAREKGTPLLHGTAVAQGLIGELYLSHRRQGFPAEDLREAVSYIHARYGLLPFSCRDYDRLLSLMLHDKKNVVGRVNFTLLSDIGTVTLDNYAGKDEIFDMLDFFCETAGC